MWDSFIYFVFYVKLERVSVTKNRDIATATKHPCQTVAWDAYALGCRQFSFADAGCSCLIVYIQRRMPNHLSVLRDSPTAKTAATRDRKTARKKCAKRPAEKRDTRPLPGSPGRQPLVSPPPADDKEREPFANRQSRGGESPTKLKTATKQDGKVLQKPTARKTLVARKWSEKVLGRTIKVLNSWKQGWQQEVMNSDYNIGTAVAKETVSASGTTRRGEFQCTHTATSILLF